ncbi:MAG TPA: hypothetical protein VGO41_01020 [Steroidobacteraceae bacterium]|nr:hypothetical protein [Steroidobacteraceae bacterium]
MKSNIVAQIRSVALPLGAALLTAAGAHAAAPAIISIPGEGVFPESLTSDRDGNIYIGSVGKSQVYRVKKGGDTAEVFIAPGTDGVKQTFGVFVDDKARTLWVCSNLLGPPPAAGAPPAPPNSLFAFDLKSGTVSGQYAFPAGGFCNDAAVGADGSVYASDTNGMQVLRLPKGGKTLEVWAGNGAFGPAGGVLDGIAVVEGRVVINTLATSKLFAIAVQKDGKAGAVTELKLDRPIERPDGMRSFGKRSLLVAEGGAGGRLSRVDLTGDTGKVTTLKEGFPDGPVAVTVVGTTGYVLEAQLAAMRAPAGTPPKPFKATAVEVGKP